MNATSAAVTSAVADTAALDALWTPNCNFQATALVQQLAATVLGLLLAPALGLLFAGSARRKNTLTVLMHSITAIAVVALVWFGIAYSITFAPSLNGIGFVGTLNWAFLAHPELPSCHGGAPAVPMSLFASYQLLFVTYSVVIVTGVWAEKLKYLTAVLFFILWPLMTYVFVAHWIWHPSGWLRYYNTVDYAGGIVALTNAGSAAWIIALVLKRRATVVTEPHSAPLVAVGGALAVIGFYGIFIGGSYDLLAASHSILGGIVAAAGGATQWSLLSRGLERRWHHTELVYGALAGLASVATSVGISAPYASLVLAMLGASSGYLCRAFLRFVAKFDDVCTVVSTFGVPAFLGALMTAFVADKRYGAPIDGIFRDLSTGGQLLVGQILGVVCVITWTSIMTLVLIYVLKFTVGLEDADKSEQTGLDLHEIGERAYVSDQQATEAAISPQQLTAKMIHYAASGEVDELKRLIDAGASPGAVDYDYRTAAHFAAYQGHIPVLELLFKHNVDLDAQDNYGSTPLSVAIGHGHQETAKWLTAHGATASNAPASARAVKQVASTTKAPIGAEGTTIIVQGSIPSTPAPAKADAKADSKKADAKKADAKKADTAADAKKADTAADAKKDDDDDSNEYSYEYQYVTEDEDADEEEEEEEVKPKKKEEPKKEETKKEETKKEEKKEEKKEKKEDKKSDKKSKK